jgi:predicted phosphodiesterase
MRIAIFSDIHGNLPALEAFVADTRADVDMYVCLGDVVNYGPWNDECLELTLSLPGIILLEGNHERLFLGHEDIAHELPLVQQFYHHSIQNFTRRDLILDLPAEHPIGTFTCTHTIAGQRIYRDTAIEVDRDYLIGHSHHAFHIERTGFHIVNCGSIGQNRRRLDYFSYVLFDTASSRFTLTEREYPVAPLLTEMIRQGYPQPCLDYYRSKLPVQQQPS